MKQNRPMGVCPACNGSKRQPYTGEFAHITAGYDKVTGTIPCLNCGGQTMSMRATGMVTLRPDGTPCLHSYTEKTVSNCYHRHTCVHCSDVYYIDSGD